MINIELDEKFYNNEVSAITLKAKVHPYIAKDNSRYKEAQNLLRVFRNGLMELIEKVQES
jgi:hypothetical protein